MDPTQRKVRYEIFRFMLDECRPPTIEDLTRCTDLNESAVVKSLEGLRDGHHLTLYDQNVPSPTPIAMAHPFSHLPTAYTVSQGDKSWWANCAWCAFGLAAMLSPAEVTIRSLTASNGECVVKLAGGEIEDMGSLSDYHVVFSAPPSKWWNDVRFACTTIQLCISKKEAENWHQKHGFYKGDVLNLDTIWQLSKAWYHDKHLYNYNRKSPEEKDKLFHEIGLTSTYWST